MKQTSTTVSLALLVILVGCSQASQPEPIPVTVETPVRMFLHSEGVPDQGLGAYGYVVFTQRPSEQDSSRYMAFCAAYLRALESIEEYEESRRDLLMVTYWFTIGHHEETTDPTPPHYPSASS